MSCACIGIYRKKRLDESFREILRKYQKHIIEDTCWFSIELEYHMKHDFTVNERQQLTKVFGCIPEQEILIFGECDRIFIAAYEMVRYFGGLLSVPLASSVEEVNSYPGTKIPIQKTIDKDQDNDEVDYWLLDHVFMRSYFKNIRENKDKFLLAPFLPCA
jgi:hypothetical protein